VTPAAATATTEPKATPKNNRGNRRAGRSKGYRGQKGGAHQLAWRDDPLIRERVALVRTLIAQGYRGAPHMLPVVNELMRKRGVPELTEDTVREDVHRVRELYAEEDSASKDTFESLQEERRHLQRTAYQAFHTTTAANPNRSRYLETIRQVIDQRARDAGLTKGGAALTLAGLVESAGDLPAPSDLVRSGKLTVAHLDAHLTVVAMQSGAVLPRSVLEGQARELPAPRPAKPRPAAPVRAAPSGKATPGPNGSRRSNGLRPEQKAVEWQGEDGIA
jgi:hypothetical protein